MHRLQRLATRMELLSEWSGRSVAWLTSGMVVITFTIVLLRYLFDTGWIAMQESVTYLHALVFMVGAAYTLRHDGHVRVDIFYRRFTQRGRAWVDLGGVLLLLLPLCGFIGVVSWEYVAESWRLLEGSREAGGLPAVFLLKSVIILMPLLLGLQGIALGLRSVLVLLGHGEAEPLHDADTEI